MSLVSMRWAADFNGHLPVVVFHRRHAVHVAPSPSVLFQAVQSQAALPHLGRLAEIERVGI